MVLFIWKLNKRVLDINEAGIRMFNFVDKAEALSIETFEQLFWDARKRRELAMAIKQNGYVNAYDVSLINRSGERLFGLITAYLFTDASCLLYFCRVPKSLPTKNMPDVLPVYVAENRRYFDHSNWIFHFRPITQDSIFPSFFETSDLDAKPFERIQESVQPSQMNIIGGVPWMPAKNPPDKNIAW